MQGTDRCSRRRFHATDWFDTDWDKEGGMLFVVWTPTIEEESWWHDDQTGIGSGCTFPRRTPLFLWGCFFVRSNFQKSILFSLLSSRCKLPKYFHFMASRFLDWEWLEFVHHGKSSALFYYLVNRYNVCNKGVKQYLVRQNWYIIRVHNVENLWLQFQMTFQHIDLSPNVMSF